MNLVFFYICTQIGEKLKQHILKKKYSIGMKVEHEIRLYAEDKYMYSM